ncbi:hypothetical protein SKAU_G00379430 [Synaphobranchus kaupii]|uniref:G-protein coupled receptors family 1 profile domain-containing protein n=1 Tax=Synaphobranchus kaupii TaxID=118154 RepID=A0A9Q1EDC3_SYNKA|nr:hypothetical protein SKAU_G00379430 [Synaphobranchus kaupii]
MEYLNNSSNSTHWKFTLEYQVALVSMYSIVFVGGIVSMALMINVLKSNILSVTTMAVLNLIAVHLLFLLTVPFRIYFYATNSWKLSRGLCRVVSGMIHAHMYIAFIFYVIILVIRYLNFFKRRDRVEFHRKLHALLASVAVWAVVLIGVLPPFAIKYGDSEDKMRGRMCFNFGGELEKGAVASLNYVIIAVVMLVTLPLACCQIWIFSQVLRKYKTSFSQQQEFWAQIKSLSFVLVMLLCFVPYHLFRIYYVSHHTSLQNENEVFLAVTAFSCLDMLTFMGRNAYGIRCEGCCLT